MLKNDRSLVFVMILFVGSSIIFTYCSDSGTNTNNKESEPANLIGPQGGSVVSNDGLVELIIPENAVSEEKVISIAKIEEEKESEKIGLPLVASYNLSPDGLSFSKPVEINYSMVNAGISDSVFTLPFLINTTEENTEVVQNSTLSFDHQNDIINITGQLQHFSVLSITKNEWTLMIEYPDEVCIGEEERLILKGSFQISDIISEFWYDMNVEFYKGDRLLTVHEPKFNKYFNIEMPFQCNTENQVPKLDLSLNINVNYDPPSDVLSTLFFEHTRFKLPDLSTAIECVECIDEPNLLSPENDAKNVELTPTLKWEEVDGVDGYEVQWVREGKSFDDENVNKAFTTEPERVLNKLDEETQYRWRVRAWRGPGYNPLNSESGNWSDIWMFTTSSASEEIIVEDVKVCVEHGESISDIYWVWQVTPPTSESSQVDMIMMVEQPDDETEQLQCSLNEKNECLMDLEIYSYGKYIYEIEDVLLQDESIPFSGEKLDGEVNVTSDGQNVGECGD